MLLAMLPPAISGAQHPPESHGNRMEIQSTYALVERWLVGSWRTASSFSSSSLFLLEAGTDREGSWSSNAYRENIIPDCGEVSWEPDRPGRLNKPGGEVKLEVEYRFGRENKVGNPEDVSRYSGGVVGSDWCPPYRPRSSCILTSSLSDCMVWASSFWISASKRLLCSRSLS